jgi:hypothetical protein
MTRVKFGLTLPNRGVITGATTMDEMLQLAEMADGQLHRSVSGSQRGASSHRILLFLGIMPRVCSATAVAFASGVFVTTMPRSAQCSRSRLSSPTLCRAITLRSRARSSTLKLTGKRIP